MPANVDISKPPGDRVRAFWEILKCVVRDLDHQAVDDNNVMRFLLHVAFHEGAELLHRKQIGGGPGRSFFQFEVPRAKEALLYADQKNWLTLLSGALNQTVDGIRSDTAKLPNSGNWPPGSAVENWLLENDYFGALLARIALRKVPAPIGTTLQAHADYWADHWKIVFDDPDDRKAKIQQFLHAAQQADALVPVTGIGELLVSSAAHSAKEEIRS